MRPAGTVLVRALALAVFAAAAAGAQVATPPMVGKWAGKAEILVNWTKQRTLPVSIAIGADDKVSGTIGDAELVNGRLQKNRGWVARALQVKTEYVIEADLSGPIIRDEHIRRASVHLPLDWRDGRFEGSVNTSGSKVGGPDRMALTAKLVLHRAPDLIICHP